MHHVAGLDDVHKRKISCLLWKSNPGHLAFIPLLYDLEPLIQCNIHKQKHGDVAHWVSVLLLFSDLLKDPYLSVGNYEIPQSEQSVYRPRFEAGTYWILVRRAKPASSVDVLSSLNKAHCGISCWIGDLCLALLVRVWNSVTSLFEHYGKIR